MLLKTDTASVFRFLLPPNSDHLMTGAHDGLLILIRSPNQSWNHSDLNTNNTRFFLSIIYQLEM